MLVRVGFLGDLLEELQKMDLIVVEDFLPCVESGPANNDGRSDA